MFLYISFQHTAVTRPLFNLNAHCGKAISLLNEIEIHSMEQGFPIHPLKANHQFLAKLYTHSKVAKGTWWNLYAQLPKKCNKPVLKMYPPASKTHSPHGVFTTMPCWPRLWIKLSVSKSKYRYFVVSAKKKDSIRSSFRWSRTSLICNNMQITQWQRTQQIQTNWSYRSYSHTCKSVLSKTNHLKTSTTPWLSWHIQAGLGIELYCRRLAGALGSILWLRREMKTTDIHT